MLSPVNKASASVVAGLLCTILLWVYSSVVHGAPPMPPEVQAAVQGLITVAFVYFGPANKP